MPNPADPRGFTEPTPTTFSMLVSIVLFIGLAFFVFLFLKDCAYSKCNCVDREINWTKMCAHAECGMPPLISDICEDVAIWANNTCDCTTPSYNKEVCHEQ